ncbi:MAG TPA: peptide-methionine (S)-S-oxide reductase MsrA [Kiritimatiellia bacterium]|nr:peptide-methionine (S)-S-oxide reductase MsrA [Kiritimatiellia bacterium]
MKRRSHSPASTNKVIRSWIAVGVLAVAGGVWMNQSMGSGAESLAFEPSGQVEVATFGGGCFWCVEAVFQRVRGVIAVTSGYKGGETENPTYREVSSGRSGHAEVVRIEFDPEVVSYDGLLDLFWKAHDPTQLNRQGADVGTQYRSVIFYHSEEQRELAEASKAKLAASGRHGDPVVTEISPASEFYEAEAYHQDYFNRNPMAPYSVHVIRGKLNKLGMKP